jgi:hypothetical protein
MPYAGIPSLGNINKTVPNASSFSLAASTDWIMSSGIYNWACATTYARLYLYDGTAWQGGGNTAYGGSLIADGSKVKLYNSATSAITIYYQQIT